MKRSSSFKSQMLGFYLNINGLRSNEGVDAPEGHLDAAYAIQQRAYELLDRALPQSPDWNKADEHEPGITFSPYEMCEESVEIDEIQGLAAFSFWLFSYHQIGLETATNFQAAVTRCYEQAAAELGGEARFLILESVVTEEVKTTTELSAGL